MTNLTKEEKQLWNTCVSFHGHVCGGLLVGFRAAMYAVQLLDLNWYKEEELLCISETDTCAVDAIQVVLGCSMGKGNLMFHITGKNAFSFYNRRTGASVRLVLRPLGGRDRVERLLLVNGRTMEELFDVTETRLEIPCLHRRIERVCCSDCGEELSEEKAVYREGRPFCIDCLQRIDRFHL